MRLASLPPQGTLLVRGSLADKAPLRIRPLRLRKLAAFLSVQNRENPYPCFQSALAGFWDLDTWRMRENRRLIHQFCKLFSTRSVCQITKPLLSPETGKWGQSIAQSAICWGWCWHSAKHELYKDHNAGPACGFLYSFGSLDQTVLVHQLKNLRCVPLF